MGLMNWINKAIDTVTTTVKEFVAPQSTSSVSTAQKTKETVPMVSKETQEAQKNEDSVEIKNKTKTRDSAYKLIEEICVKYDIDMEEAKKYNFLESITGFSSEELATKTKDDLAPFMEALKKTLSNRQWTFWKSNSGEENLKKIAKSANDNYIDSVTGRGFWGNLFRSNKDVSEKLKKAGYNEVNEANVKAYFQSLISDAVASGDKNKIEDAYKDAFKTFGDLLKDTQDPQQRAVLTAAISELKASVRNTAARLSITSCQNDKKSQMFVAKAINTNYRAMTCSKDALGNRTSEEDNLEIAQTAFQYMSEEDSIAALDETKSYIKSLETKIQNGETLTEEEQIFYDSVRFSQYAGAIVGASCNVNYASPDNVLGKIDTDTAELGIQERVYQTASAYVESHQDSLPITTQQFTQKVNNATNGNYSTVIANSTASNVYTVASAKTTSSQNTKTQNNTTTQNSQNTTVSAAVQTQTTPQVQIDTQSSSQTEFTIAQTNQTDGTTAPPKTDTVQTRSEQKKVSHTDNPKAATAAPERVSTGVISRDNAIKGGVKAVKQYAKDNNLNTLDLAIDSLNSSFASSSTRKWALAQFEAASNSEQVLNFHKITHSSSALAAAQTMDDKTRSQLNTFRSYYIKEAVENLDETSIA
ncbi:MAG: hypothetical protein NC408_03035 [Candidatus Gastranaerophilales bacterium]|nr:hypothetical protein [Candidatus Gastranaerophilales bacterium]MCM1072704.1 hypothetical protein [Bacteroides sp.]